jgi:D-lactate dehydrogenase (cytochrome)
MDCLADYLNEDQISTAEEVLDNHSSDFSMTADGLRPEYVVFPETTRDVSRVLAELYRREIPVTPYALGTGLEGMAVPAQGGVSLDMTRMDSVLDVRPEDFQVDVQPGVVGSDINETVESNGLFFPPLPTSGEISTIGGMAANDASGKHTVKYGEVQDWIMAMEVVLPDGRVTGVGSKARKTSAGYNLKDLFVGSEGTLGVITRLTLELAGLPEQIVRGRVLFNQFDDAVECVRDLVQSGVDVAALEFVDTLSIKMANEYLDADLPAQPGLFLEFHADHGVQDELDFARTIINSYNPTRMDFSEDPNAMEDLWEARRELAWAVASYREDLEPVQPGDVTVPISKFPDMVRYIRNLADEENYLIPCFGHAGDGNLHYSVLVDRENQEHLEDGREIYESIVQRAIDVGGTATGEHGIGLGKRKFLETEHGPHGVETMRTIKEALDPKNTMNPGKIFPD